MANGKRYDVAVIGGGPGGYVAALRAAQLDCSVACIEERDLGGTCLNRGCIPAKAFLETAAVKRHVDHAADFGIEGGGAPSVNFARTQQRKQGIVDGLVKGLGGLLQARNVEVEDGFGRLVDGGAEVAASDGSTKILAAKNVIVATGSVPRSIPGYEIDGVRIVTSDQALDWTSRPDRVAVIGAGAIGVEFASFLTDQRGTEAVEWGMIAGLMVGGLVLTLAAIGIWMESRYQGLLTGLGS